MDRPVIFNTATGEAISGHGESSAVLNANVADDVQRYASMVVLIYFYFDAC